MPTSDKQLAANRANAARSTGPRTPEGKARSAQNARTHGFTATTFAVVRVEDLREVERLKDDLVAHYQPRNSQELFAIERMAIAQQSIVRAARLECGVFINCLDMALNDDGTPFSPLTPKLVGHGDIEVTQAQNRNYALADGFCRMARQNNSFSLFLRYKARPNSSTAVRSKNSTVSRPCDPNYEMNPFPTPNPKKPNQFPHNPRNPFWTREKPQA